MARIRYLKPEFFEDEDLAKFPYEIRLFFAGLWNFADKAGRLEDRPERLKVKIFPYDKVDAEKCLQELSKVKNGSRRPFIQRYEAEGERYIQIVCWNKHQKPHHTEASSKIPPAPPLNTTITEKGTIKGMGSVLQTSAPTNNVSLTVNSTLKEIIDDLNAILKTTYKYSTAKTNELIQARLHDGHTLDDFKVVHRKMVQEWGADEKMAKYLRPITLYSNKFESYLNMKSPDTKLGEKGVKAVVAAKSWLEKRGDSVNQG